MFNLLLAPMLVWPLFAVEPETNPPSAETAVSVEAARPDVEATAPEPTPSDEAPSAPEPAPAENMATEVTAEPAPAAEPEPTPATEDVEVIEDVTDVSEISPFSSESWSNAEAFATLERGVNILNAKALTRGNFLIIVNHRAREPFTQDAWRDFFGLDAGGLKIGLGVRYGIWDHLDAGVYRLNGTSEVFDTYQLDLRYQLLEQQDYVVDLAALLGGTWFAQNGDQAGGFYGQVMVGRTFFERLRLDAAVLFHSDSSSDKKRSVDSNPSVAAALIADVRIASFMAWQGEVAWAFAGYAQQYPAWSTAIKFITTRHTFSLVLSNTQYNSADGLVANAWRDFENLIIGLSLTREI